MDKARFFLGSSLMLAVLLVGGIFWSAWRWQVSDSNLATSEDKLVFDESASFLIGNSDTAAVVPVNDSLTTAERNLAAPDLENSSTPEASTPVTVAEDTVAPTALQTVLANFYAAYEDRDKERLAVFFTPDSSDEDRSLRSTLFQGFDLKNNPGGPTLFSTPTASQFVDAYTLVATGRQDAGWVTTVEERRLNSLGERVSPTTSILVWQAGTGENYPWLIQAYYRAGGSAGKYGGFLIQ